MRKAVFLFLVGFASTAALVSSQQRNAVAFERGGALRGVQEVARKPVMDPVAMDLEDDDSAAKNDTSDW